MITKEQIKKYRKLREDSKHLTEDEQSVLECLFAAAENIDLDEILYTITLPSAMKKRHTNSDENHGNQSKSTEFNRFLSIICRDTGNTSFSIKSNN